MYAMLRNFPRRRDAWEAMGLGLGIKVANEQLGALKLSPKHLGIPLFLLTRSVGTIQAHLFYGMPCVRSFVSCNPVLCLLLPLRNPSLEHQRRFVLYVGIILARTLVLYIAFNFVEVKGFCIDMGFGYHRGRGNIFYAMLS